MSVIAKRSSQEEASPSCSRIRDASRPHMSSMDTTAPSRSAGEVPRIARAISGDSRTTQQATLRALGDSELRQIVNRFADAWERNDVDVDVAMLADDARMTMPPWPSWYSGRDAIATFLRSWPLSLRKRWQLLRTGANGQPVVAGYLWDEQTTAFKAEAIIVLSFQAARLEEITAFRSPELFPRFGLPKKLTNDVGSTTALAPTPASHYASLASPRPIEEDVS
jgi:RNA polymerase sigma-70 factor (ECF subfamily)